MARDSKPHSAATPTLAFENPKVIAVALAVPGAQLERVTESANGRLVFHVGGLPSDFLNALNDGTIEVDGRAVIEALERTLKTIEEQRRRRRWR